MAKKIKCKVGDIFSIPVSDTEFIYGQVLFDVTSQYINNAHILPSDINKSYLGFFNESLLVRTFKGVCTSINAADFDNIAVDSTFVFRDFLSKHNGRIERNIEINPTLVSFPEVLSRDNMIIYLAVGELYIPIPISGKEYEEIGVYPSSGYGYYNVIMATLDYSGRSDLVGDHHMDNYFRGLDLRSTPELRAKIYNLAKESLNQSYYNMALKHGFDLSRLY